MLSYPIAEAETLLDSKLSTAQQSLENCEEDLDFLREQITVSWPILPVSVDVLLPEGCRLWRLQLQGYTIGTLPRDEKKKRIMAKKKRRRRERRKEEKTNN